MEGADVAAEDTVFGRTALRWAAENGHKDVVELLKRWALEKESSRIGIK